MTAHQTPTPPETDGIHITDTARGRTSTWMLAATAVAVVGGLALWRLSTPDAAAVAGDAPSRAPATTEAGMRTGYAATAMAAVGKARPLPGDDRNDIAAYFHPGDPEPTGAELITALNEEAVAAAALGNKGGLNLIVSYEAFAVKMLGLMRQEIIFARRQKELGHAPGWLSVPLVVTSHTWENSKNEQSHQDPTIGEALLGEMSDTARVLFPVDGNTAVAALRDVYGGRGQVACVVVSKREVTQRFDADGAQAAVARGAAHVAGDPADAALQFVAIGAYQLDEALKAQAHLAALGHRACVTAVMEPGRLRIPRDGLEAAFVDDDATLHALFPPGLPRVLLSHTRPEPMVGVLRRIDDGPATTRALGYISRGGTLDVAGMLFANRCTWAHAVDAAAAVAGLDRATLLGPAQRRAIDGVGDPADLLDPDAGIR